MALRQDPRELAAAQGGALRRSDPNGTGIRRRRRGRGFSYLRADGAPVTDPRALARIKALVIPPAWQDVWICTDPRGHIQAIGTDAAGRRQYRYHDLWREQRDQDKHDRVQHFGAALPAILTGMRISMAGAWTSIIAAELIAATNGLGYLIVQASDYLNTALVFSGIIAIAILGLTLDACLRGLLLLADPSRRR